MGKWSIRMTILTVTLALYTGSLCTATEVGTQTEAPAARQRIGMSSSETVHRQSGDGTWRPTGRPDAVCDAV